MSKKNQKAPLEDFTLSLFKEYKVSYYLNRPNIVFTCFYCVFEAKLNLNNQSWSCDKCKIHGKMSELITYLKVHNAPIRKVYDPQKEKNEIGKALKRLINANLNNSLGNQLSELEKRMNGLWLYLNNLKE
jgi:ribosomal protein L37AE/L43A